MDPITIAMSLAQFAPSIIKLLTGSEKAEQVAGAVIGVAKAVTGMPDGPAAVAAIQADPTKVMEFQQAMAERQDEMERAYLVDRQDARKRDTAIVLSGRYNWRGDFLALLAVAALCLCVYLVAGNPDLPPGAREAIMFVAGVFAGCVRDVYGFEFGSSRASKAKDDTISRLSGA